jgi:2-keto-4-pentenoate hydratase/2-oxohepta-3-ene-1,7-dioic acid hydratase in catechol pathway
MRWIRYSTPGQQPAYGLLHDTQIEPVTGDPFGQWQASGRSLNLAEVKIEVPVMPRTFYAAGLNYTAHVRDVGAALGMNIPTQPDMGYRAVNALIAQDEDIIVPADATEAVQYEGELVVVIGRQAKHLSEADALSCVFGYTIGNDVSERTWQKSDRTFWRSKNTDTFKPMGPWIETEVDLDAMQTEVRVNGVVKTSFHTNEMLFGIARYLSTMTRYLTLYPGDVVWMGTDGVSPNLVHGDLVEVSISGIGTLRNRVVREAKA